MASVTQWVEGARIRTLPAAIAPVLAGSGAAAQLGGFSLPRAALAGGVALALQIAVNFANDYSDGVRGTDNDRIGPFRLTGSGAASPAAVRGAAFISFAVAAAFGLWLVVLAGQWWLLLVGLACVVAAWGYTGGRYPYGYLGLGEVGVFVFFGLVAVLGTTYTQAGSVSWQAACCAVAIGLFACAILMTNNLRDRETDAAAGKRTLAVRLGDRGARWAYVLFMAVPFILAGVLAADAPRAAVALILLIPSARACIRVSAGATGAELIGILRATGIVELGYGLLIGLGLGLS